MRRRAAILGLACGAAALLYAQGANAGGYCPSYQASSPNNTNNCGFDAVPGTNPSPDEYGEFYALVAGGPAAWSDQGPAATDLDFGCGGGSVAATFPCVLMKGIGARESGWGHFCVPDRPADQVGQPSQTVISFDCGYGAGQITSGMHAGETPPFDQLRVAAEPLYNIATGAQIFAEKWNNAACVGGQNPEIVEHWYLAVWGYNGFSYTNNPNNPTFDSTRGVFDPAVGGAAPYQELVFGAVEHPLNDYWLPVELAYPPLGELGTDGTPDDISEPSCASPTDCTSNRDVHEASCAVEGEGGSSGGDTGSTSSTDPTTGPDATTDGLPSTSTTTSPATSTSAASDPSATSEAGTGDSVVPTSSETNALPQTFGDSDDGCGCGTPRSRPSALLGLLMLVFAARRRVR